MMRCFIILIFLLVNVFCAISQTPVLIESEASEKAIFSFPKNFSFGASTAAYQIEGGWKDDGRGPSIWDTLVHNHPELIADRTTPDIGPDSYHFYKSDVKALKQVGVNNLMCFRYQTFYLFTVFNLFVPSSSIIASRFHGPEYSPMG